MKQWYTIAILPQYIDKVKLHLNNQNFTAFFPEVITHLTKKQVPMFKGYAFVQFDIEKDQWLSINSTYGVIKLVPKHLIRPIPMPDQFINTLIKRNPVREEDWRELLIELFTTTFYPGQQIELKETDDPHSIYEMLTGKQAIVLQVREKLLEISFLYANSTSNAIWVNKDAVKPFDSDVSQKTSEEHKVYRGTRRAPWTAVAVPEGSI